MNANRSGNSSSRVSAPFVSCYRQHWTAVFRWCLRYGGGNPAWAEDLAHDVFLRLLERFPELSQHDDLGGWLYRTTANMAISRLRGERSWTSRWANAWRALQNDSSPSAEVIVVHRQRAAKALATLTALPPLERMVVSMKLLDGESQRDIAQMLDVSEGYVCKLLKRGLQRIRADGWVVEENRDDG